MRLRPFVAMLAFIPTFTFAAASTFAHPDARDLPPAVNDAPERLAFEDLPFENAFTVIRGEGSRRLAVFQDPTCIHSRKLHEELQYLDDVTIYVFLYPVLSDESRSIATAVWCAADRGSAWLEVMAGKKEVATSTPCESPIEDLVRFGKENEVRGTPTLVFENGERVRGAITAEQIEERLAKATLIRIARR